jgi:hypothetical protein
VTERGAGVGASHTLRVQVQTMGSQKYEHVGESQPVLIMNDPIISPCTRTCKGATVEHTVFARDEPTTRRVAPRVESVTVPLLPQCARALLDHPAYHTAHTLNTLWQVYCAQAD